MASPNSSVQVAVRIRPLVESELAKGCQDVLEVYPELSQIRIKNTDKAFTYNYVLSTSSSQIELYGRCVQDLIDNIFKGYNVTILAYGQTGSGKTYSMGTTYNGHGEMGIIPRAIYEIFENIRDKFSYDFFVTVSFMELYQEVLYDLLSDKPRDQCTMEIREDPTKGIFVQGLTEIAVKTSDEVLDLLEKGSLGRSTGSTNMNAHSSRSHAVFAINVTMQNKDNLNERKTARFNLVDLAGSERSKKTGAVGTTFKEGVNINKGLMVLGNVISCLGDEKLQNGHIPYRDSNLTRLLRDSLGGNSITLMIACVSPADYNMEETISTLRYADRARKIKNKPVVNQDAKAAEIIELRKTIQQLRLQIIGQGGPVKCNAEIEALQKENIETKCRIEVLTCQLSSVLSDNTVLHERILMLQAANESLNKKLADLKADYNTTLNNISAGVETNNIEEVKSNLEKLHTIHKQFSELQDEHNKTECELRSHEDTFVIHSEKSEPTEPEISDRQAVFAKQQMALRNELEQITKTLAVKELLARQIQDTNKFIIDYTGLEENQDKVNQLMKEKDELIHQLKNAQNKEGFNKLAEQRRKRVQELELQIEELKKKINGQARLIKLKEKDEMKIKKLDKEIASIKHDKVQLIRKMREESDRFRVWRQQRERELAKLKHEDRKKQNQIVKMEAMHTKQQNVLKRKVEEAAAINKRLRDALALRKQAQEQRLGGKLDRVSNWLKQELELFMNIVEADSTMHDLLEDRATLQRHLNEMKMDADSDPNEIKSIQEEVEMRSLQIQDLQQKIFDFNEDDKAKTRWENIQCMAEAKSALKILWDAASITKKNEVAISTKLGDLQQSINELTKKNQDLEEKNKALQQKRGQDVDQAKKEEGEKVSLFVNMLREKGLESSDPHIKIFAEKTYEFEQEKIAAQNKCKELEERLEKISEALQEANERLSNGLTVENSTPEKRVTIKVTRVKKTKPQEGLFVQPNDKENVLDSSTDYESDMLDDDVTKDPDWRKTPLGKRIIEGKKNLMREQMSKAGTKRTSDGGCMCGKLCSSRCSCLKLTKSCASSCKCPSDCANRIADSATTNIEQSTADLEQDADPKKPRTTDIIDSKYFSLPEPTRKRGRNLFDPSFKS